MKQWKKRNDCKNFGDYVLHTTGRTMSQLLSESYSNYTCPGIGKVAELLTEAKNSGKRITGVFDFDADGICSTAEMHMLLTKIGIPHGLIVPKRLSEGYGLNADMVDRMEGSDIVITVDNGITANEAVAAAKSRGMQVIIMDHHNALGDVPDADIIVDAEEFPEGWTFTHYCGAGLVYKLAEYMYPDDTAFLNVLSCFAAIATVGDVVNVTADNHNIIRRGLENINKRQCTPGLAGILNLIAENSNIDPFTVSDIAMKVVPLINAPGRLYDDGGEQVLRCLFAGTKSADAAARKIYDINEQRKQMVQDALDTMSPKGDNISFLYHPDLKEGICGIIAGRYSAENHKPSYVMTRTEDGLIKGSARCEEGYNVFQSLGQCREYLTKFGGHDCAAGFSFREEDLDRVFNILEQSTERPEGEESEFYDLDVEPADILPLYCDQNKIGIFGEGLKRPVLRMKALVEDPRVIGQKQNVLSFKAANTKCIGFSLAEKYHELGSPSSVVLYGTLDINWFRKRPCAQITVLDIEPA